MQPFVHDHNFATVAYLWPMEIGTAFTGVTPLPTPTSPVSAPLRAPWPGAVAAGFLLSASPTGARPFAASCCFEEDEAVVLGGVVVFAAPASAFFGGAVAAVVF
jgi:hypothetical protein